VQTFTIVALKCGLTAPKTPKFLILGINLPQRGISTLAIFTKFGLGEEVPGLHLHANFHCCGFKNVGLQPPKSSKTVFFVINLPQGKIQRIQPSYSLSIFPQWGHFPTNWPITHQAFKGL